MHKVIAGRRESVATAVLAARNVAIGGGVIVSLIHLLLGLATLVTAGPALAQSAPVAAGVRLQAGIEKENVDGDLRSAMEIYQKIASDKSAPRDVRAKALLRLAGCDEKLGRQAKQVYEQILRDYAEQPAASQARKRLEVIRVQLHPALPATMSMRKIDGQTLGSLGAGDTDGERGVYYSEGQLFFGDLVGHSRHLIGDFTHLGTIPSRDFSMVALNLKSDSNRPHTLAVIKTDGTGYRELIRDDAKNNAFGITSSFNMTWSWDDKYLLVSDFHPWSNLHGQVWIVSVADGRRRVLVDQGNGNVRKSVFSPNGQYVAYESWPRDDLSDQTSRVFVVPIQGGEPRLVFESARWQPGNQVRTLIDWTADGRYLAVHDIRKGKSALYLQPMKEGTAVGEASFVRYGAFDDGYATIAGALVVQDETAQPGNARAFLASIDSDGHLGTWKYLYLNTCRDPRPSFSPDGTQIAYVGIAADLARRNLIVRDLATGQEREIYQSAYGSLACQYSIHNPKIFCSVEKEYGESELLSVDADSSVVEHLADFPEPRYLMRSGWGDQTFYFSPNGWRWQTFDPPFIEWNRSTGQETVVATDRYHFQMPTPDGHSVVGLWNGTLSVRTTTGSDQVPLVSGIGMNAPVYSPDGKWVFYQDRDEAGKIALFRVPIAGGQPLRMGGSPGNAYYRDYFFSSDARQVLAWVGGTIDLWLLEHFEPTAQK